MTEAAAPARGQWPTRAFFRVELPGARLKLVGGDGGRIRLIEEMESRQRDPHQRRAAPQKGHKTADAQQPETMPPTPAQRPRFLRLVKDGAGGLRTRHQNAP